MSLAALTQSLEAASAHFDRHIKHSLSAGLFEELAGLLGRRRIGIEQWVSLCNLVFRADWRNSDFVLLFERLGAVDNALYPAALKTVLCV